MRSATEWNNILIQCQVKPTIAATWSLVFADTVKDDTFSKGDTEAAEFLGQILHESQGLIVMSENLDYTAARIVQIGTGSPIGSRWRALVPRAYELQHRPREFANALYGGRMGNDMGDDGWNFRGRSPVEITGKGNYLRIGELMGQDLSVMPELLEQPHFALEATIFWWNDRIPDSMIGDVEKITHRVQGGDLGLKHRIALTAEATKALA